MRQTIRMSYQRKFRKSALVWILIFTLICIIGFAPSSGYFAKQSLVFFSRVNGNSFIVLNKYILQSEKDTLSIVGEDELSQFQSYAEEFPSQIVSPFFNNHREERVFLDSLLLLRDTTALVQHLTREVFLDNFPKSNGYFGKFIDIILTYDRKYPYHLNKEAILLYMGNQLAREVEHSEAAIELFESVYQQCKENKQIIGMVLSKFSLLALTSGQSNFDEWDIRELIKDIEQGDTNNLNSTIYNLIFWKAGQFYEQINLLDSALFYYNQIMEFGDSTTGWFSKDGMFTVRLAIAKVKRKQGNTAEALQIIEDIKRKRQDIPEPRIIFEAIWEAGKIWAAKDNIDKAVEAFKEALAIAHENSLDSELTEFLLDLETLYVRKGNFQQAYSVGLQKKRIYDSLFLLNKNRNIRAIEAEYAKEVKEKEKQFLKGRLEERETALLIRSFIFGVIFCLLVVLLFLVRVKNRLSTELKQAYNTLMKRYKEEVRRQDLHHSKKEIMDSGRSEQQESNTFTFQTILAYINNNQLYLNSKLKVSDVCEEMGINGKSLSNILRENGYVNFAGFINELRVLHAKKLLQNKEYSIYTIAGIGKLSGFGSIQRFYDTFEEFTGLKPGMYRDNFE